MKKLLIALSLILCLSLVLVACGKNKNNEDETEKSTKKDPAEISETTGEETEPNESEETSSEKKTESTTEKSSETTSEATTTDEDEILEFMSRVDKAMEEIEHFQLTEITDTYMDGESMGAEKTVTRFDGYYAHIANYSGDQLVSYMYLIDNLLLYNDGEYYNDVVINLSENELNYFLSEMVMQTSEEDGGYEEILSSFKSVKFNDNSIGGYDLCLEEPTEEFLASLGAELADMGVEISNISYLFSFNSDYTCNAIVVEMTMSMMGMEFTSTTTESYDYEEFYLDGEVQNNFDGYTVVEFEDVFGYIDTSYGKDIGLDVDSDNYTLDYNNEDRLSRQIVFLESFADEYLGKTFTLYGTVLSEEGVYGIDILGAYYDISFADGVTPLDNGTLACLTGKLVSGIYEYEGVEYPVYYFEITSASAITEADIPEGGYLPWVAYVTARSLNVRATPDFSSSANNKVGVLSADTEIKIVGFIDPKYCMIEYHWETADGQSGEYAYVSLAYLAKVPSYYLTLDDGYKPVNPPM